MQVGHCVRTQSSLFHEKQHSLWVLEIFARPTILPNPRYLILCRAWQTWRMCCTVSSSPLHYLQMLSVHKTILLRYTFAGFCQADIFGRSLRGTRSLVLPASWPGHRRLKRPPCAHRYREGDWAPSRTKNKICQSSGTGCHCPDTIAFRLDKEAGSNIQDARQIGAACRIGLNTSSSP